MDMVTGSRYTNDTRLWKDSNFHQLWMLLSHLVFNQLITITKWQWESSRNSTKITGNAYYLNSKNFYDKTKTTSSLVFSSTLQENWTCSTKVIDIYNYNSKFRLSYRSVAQYTQIYIVFNLKVKFMVHNTEVGNLKLFILK